MAFCGRRIKEPYVRRHNRMVYVFSLNAHGGRLGRDAIGQNGGTRYGQKSQNSEYRIR